jgi:hypothetical protein
MPLTRATSPQRECVDLLQHADGIGTYRYQVAEDPIGVGPACPDNVGQDGVKGKSVSVYVGEQGDFHSSKIRFLRNGPNLSHPNEDSALDWQVRL